MKKPLSIVIVLVILGVAVWYFGGNKSQTTPATPEVTPGASAIVSETTQVSDRILEYKNEELGFSVKYPVGWDMTATDSAVTFNIPAGKEKTHTIARIEAKVMVQSGKCSFPPVTTVKDRSTLKSGSLDFNMISMSNSVQGRNYFDRMYSQQRDGICYIFSFSSIALNPTTKGYKGSEATQMTNNNKAIIDSVDSAFTTMVKSFAYVVGAVGQDESVASPAKK